MAEDDKITVTLHVDQRRAIQQMGLSMAQFSEACRSLAQSMADGVHKSTEQLVKAMSKTDVRVVAAAIRKAERMAETATDDEAGFMEHRVIRVRGCTPMQSIAKQSCASCDWASVWEGGLHVKCRRFKLMCNTQRLLRETGHQSLCGAFIPTRPRSCLNCAFFRHDPKQYAPEQGFCDLLMVVPRQEGNPVSVVKLLTSEDTEPCTHWRPAPPKVCSACRHGLRNNDTYECQKARLDGGRRFCVSLDDLDSMHCEKDFEPDLQAIATKEFVGLEQWTQSWFDMIEFMDDDEIDELHNQLDRI